jgi:hypothetical protein
MNAHVLEPPQQLHHEGFSQNLDGAKFSGRTMVWTRCDSLQTDGWILPWREVLRSRREGDYQGALTRMLFNLLPVRSPLGYPIATTPDQQTHLAGRKVSKVGRQTQQSKPVRHPDGVFSRES